MATVYMRRSFCRVCDVSFTHPVTRGRPPVYCDEHRKTGPQIMKKREQEALAAENARLRRERREQAQREREQAQQDSQSTPQSTYVPPMTDDYATTPVTQAKTIVTDAYSSMGKFDGTHKMFGALRAMCMINDNGIRINPLLIGPSGSGKSYAVTQLAEMLELEMREMSCNPQMTEYSLLGFVDAHGVYQMTALIYCFINGGAFLFDEMDASNPEVLVTINLLASLKVGGFITLPNGERVARHKDFILIAGCNTINGADDVYVGRQQLDAASLNRFKPLYWDYDEEMELQAAGEDMQAWTKRVQKIRQVVKDNNLPLLVTPRASIDGAAMLRNGMPQTIVEDVCFWNFTDDDTRRSVNTMLAF